MMAPPTGPLNLDVEAISGICGCVIPWFRRRRFFVTLTFANGQIDLHCLLG